MGRHANFPSASFETKPGRTSISCPTWKIYSNQSYDLWYTNFKHYRYQFWYHYPVTYKGRTHQLITYCHILYTFQVRQYKIGLMTRWHIHITTFVFVRIGSPLRGCQSSKIDRYEEMTQTRVAERMSNIMQNNIFLKHKARVKQYVTE